jgi:ATP-dependent helicase/nuclease subunit A
LQLIDLAEPRDLEAQVRRQCEIESIPELSEQAEKLVRAALASDAVQLATRHRHHKELYVAAPVGPRVVEGYVDLLVETPDGLVVVDYKTDSARTEAEVDEKLAAYELQGATYAVAVEAVTGRAVHACRFVFCRASGAIERTVRDLPAAMARARAVVERGAAEGEENNADGEEWSGRPT